MSNQEKPKISYTALEKEYSITRGSLSRYLKKHPNTDVMDAISHLQTAKRTRRQLAPNQTYYMDENGQKIKISVVDYAKRIGCSKTPLYNKLKEGYSLEEAGRIVTSNQHETFPDENGNQKTLLELSIEHQVGYEYLCACNRKDPHFREHVSDYLNAYQHRGKMIRMKDGTTLKQYCIQNGYNYRVIYEAMKKKNMSLEDAISTYLAHGQSEPRNWKYEYHGIILSHLLTKYQLDSHFILEQLRNKVSLLDAIRKALFENGWNQRICPHHKLFLEILQMLEECPSTERMMVLERTSLTPEEKRIFEERYNRFSIIRRDLFLIRMKDEMKGQSDTEKKRLKEHYQLTEEEFNYVEKMLQEGFLETISLQEKGQFHHHALYYHPPKKKTNSF